jgi:hypothetical protein
MEDAHVRIQEATQAVERARLMHEEVDKAVSAMAETRKQLHRDADTKTGQHTVYVVDVANVESVREKIEEFYPLKSPDGNFHATFTTASAAGMHTCVTVGEDGQGEGAGKGGAVEIDGVKITQDGCMMKQTRDSHPSRLDIKGGSGGHAYGGGKGGDGGEIKVTGAVGNMRIVAGNGGAVYGKGKAGKDGSVIIEGRPG